MLLNKFVNKSQKMQRRFVYNESFVPSRAKIFSQGHTRFHRIPPERVYLPFLGCFPFLARSVP